MKRDELYKHENNIMRCKKCGAEYKYFEIVARGDSCELPGNMLWMRSCKKCGECIFDEIESGDIRE